jgi:hypothetical protein
MPSRKKTVKLTIYPGPIHLRETKETAKAPLNRIAGETILLARMITRIGAMT